jgi:hypothetical protein
MKMSKITVTPKTEQDRQIIANYLESEAVIFEQGEKITFKVPTGMVDNYIDKIEKELLVNFTVSIQHENAKVEFSCAPNNFKASYYSGNVIYLMCGKLAVQVVKAKLNKTLKSCSTVTGFTYPNHPGKVWVTGLL